MNNQGGGECERNEKRLTRSAPKPPIRKENMRTRCDYTALDAENEVLRDEIKRLKSQKTVMEHNYTEEMRKLNEEWKENLALQRKMLIDKACRKWCNGCEYDNEGNCIMPHGRCLFYTEFRKSLEE